MFRYIFILFVLKSVFSTSFRGEWKECAEDEFECEDGECVSLDNICNGKKICNDASDLHICNNHPHLVASNITLLRRKRQSKCRNTQWQCRDGSCIGIDGKCDGVVDCPDGSDETHPLCRKMQCQNYWFRCTYGACVDGTAPCNGIQECADNSDELLPRCRNETDEVKGQFRCQNGQVISAAEHCDGAVDCTDGSDETVGVCAAKTCPSYLFQCAYGACVDQGSDCNGIQDCADGSDESDELCNRMSSVTTTTMNPIPGGGKCVLPPYPKHGTYVVKGRNASPGQTVHSAFLEISCESGFDVENTGITTDNNNTMFCYEGVWSRTMPRCVRYCRLPKHASVEYRCLVTGSVEGSRECGLMEPSGTEVKPICRRPNYYYSGILPFMRCIDGSWDYVAICKPGGNITINISDFVVIYITTHDNNTNIQISTDKQNASLGDLINVNVNGANINIVSNNNKLGNNGNTDSDNSNKYGTTSTTESIDEYDIDEGDWRMSQVQVTRPKDAIVFRKDEFNNV